MKTDVDELLESMPSVLFDGTLDGVDLVRSFAHEWGFDVVSHQNLLGTSDGFTVHVSSPEGPGVHLTRGERAYLLQMPQRDLLIVANAFPLRLVQPDKA